MPGHGHDSSHFCIFNFFSQKKNVQNAAGLKERHKPGGMQMSTTWDFRSLTGGEIPENIF